MAEKLPVIIGQKAKNFIENMVSTKQEKQVVSRKRVADHGEVYTAKREVNAMLELSTICRQLNMIRPMEVDDE